MRTQKLMTTLLCCLGSIAPSFGQTTFDSLFQASNNTSNDTLRINAYNELARMHIPDSLALAENWANRAYTQAQKKNYTKGLIYATKNKGLIADYRGELSKAINYYDIGIKICAQSTKWEKERIDFIANKGVAYYFAGDLGKAIHFYSEAEKALSKDQRNPTYAKVINNLASVYRNLKRYPDAIRMYKKSLFIKKQTLDSIGIANTLNNIGLCYAYQNLPRESVQYLTQAQNAYRALGQTSDMLSVNVSLAVAYNELGQLAKAKHLLKQSITLPNLKLSIHDLTQAKLLYVKILYGDKEYQHAQAVLKEIEPEILKTNFLKSKVTFYEWKAYVLHAIQENVAAYQALIQHKLYLDTLNVEAKLSLEKDMEAKYLNQEKEAQIQIQKLQLLKNKRERLVFVFAMVALLLILGFAYRLSAQRKRANQLLGEKNKLIQQALEDKETLLKEIHHRVKNNLQIISSLLSLQSRRVEDPKVLEAIQDGQNRVQSMALIHQNLYQDENLVTVDAQLYIDQLIENLVRSYNVNPDGVTFSKNIDKLTLDVDTLIPLGLILNELISNTLKYAFEPNKSGQVNLSLKQQKNGLLLKISDNGQGFPPDIDLKNLKSMGFRLIYSFTKKLNGVLKTWNEQGAHVEMFIPHSKLS